MSGEREDGIPLDQRERGGGLIRSNEPVVPPHPENPRRDLMEEFLGADHQDRAMNRATELKEKVQTGQCIVGPDGNIIHLSGGIV